MTTLAGAREAADELARHAAANEAATRLGRETVDTLRSLDAFRLFLPTACGGSGVGLPEAMSIIETLSAADAAAGWVATISSQTSHIAGSIRPDVAHAVFSDPRSIANGAFAPNGRARAVNGGHRLSGRWAWGSGCELATWLTGGCLLENGEFHQMIVPAEQVTIHRTWDPIGLAGTGSHDIEMADVFVPDGYSVMFGQARPTVDEPISRTPGFVLFAGGIASVMLGIAQRALDDVVELAGVKKPSQSSKTLSASAITQHDIARLEARLRSARAYLQAEVGTVWSTVLSGGRVSQDQRLAVRLAAAYAAAECVGVVGDAYRIGGGTSVFRASSLQRCLRDVQAASAHVMVSARTFETYGRARLGLPIDVGSI